MTVAEMETALDSAIRRRAREEEAATNDGRMPAIAEMRAQVVALKLAGKPYAELAALRDAEVASVMSEVNETRREIKALRARLSAARKLERMAKYEAMTSEDLRFKLAQHLNAFRAEKAEAGAIRAVLNARHTESETLQLIEAMSDAQRASMYAELKAKMDAEAT